MHYPFYLTTLLSLRLSLIPQLLPARSQVILKINRLHTFPEHTLYIICTFRIISMQNERMS